MKCHIIASFLLLASIHSIIGQDSIKTETKQLPTLSSESISFIQFNTVRDPANVGIQGRNISLNSFSNLPNDNFNEDHNSISIDSYLGKKQTFGVGIYYTLDNWSDRLYKNSLGLALKTKVKNFHIGLGIEKNTYYQDSTDITFGDMIDPRVGFIYSTQDISAISGNRNSYINFRPSLIYNNDKLKVGISLNNITEPSVTLTHGGSNIPMETNINISYFLRLKEKWSYTPMIQFFNTNHNQLLEIHNILTFSDIRKTHFLDLSYVNQKSVNIQYGMNFNNRFKFYGKINIPIYFANYFPLSAQAGIQYTFKPKK